MRIPVYAVLISLFSALVLADLSIPKFRNTPFKVRPYSGMYQIGGLQLDNVTTGIQIAAYGDFNNDKYTDFVSISDDLSTLTVFIYSYSSASFWNFTSISLTQSILSITPADYNYDGLLDLMITTQNSDGVTMHVSVYYRSMNFPFFTTQQESDYVPLDLNLEIQPSLFDPKGTRQVNLLYTVEGVRYYTSLIDNSPQPFQNLISTNPFNLSCKDPSEALSYTFSTPHSNAFVDFNGDCAADLFITSTDGQGNLYFEIWLKNPQDEQFCLVDFVKMTLENISMVSIADMDNDGRLDLVYVDSPSNLSAPMNLHILYNRFSTNPSSPCSLPTSAMISPFTSESYNSEVSIQNQTQVTQILSSYIGASRLYSPDMQYRPPKIRLGDVNVDGLVDMLIVVTESNNEHPLFGFTLLGINNGEGNGIAFDATGNSQLGPYFSVNVNTTGDSSSTTTPLSLFPTLYASFFDFDEKGSLGIWMTQSNQLSGTNTSLMGIYNFVSTSNFILKALGLNGYVSSSDNILDSLGGIYPGASVECTVTDVEGDIRLAKATQLGQTAYSALEPPYAFIGLGRTNNYVQDFTMGIAQSIGPNDAQQTTWTPIIPNSQLIVNPLINDDWTLDVYVSPISQTMLVIVATLAVLFLLGIVILVLHIRERKADKKNQERFLYVFG